MKATGGSRVAKNCCEGFRQPGTKLMRSPTIQTGKLSSPLAYCKYRYEALHAFV